MKKLETGREIRVIRETVPAALNLVSIFLSF